jgi:hypothetical protein
MKSGPLKLTTVIIAVLFLVYAAVVWIYARETGRTMRLLGLGRWGFGSDTGYWASANGRAFPAHTMIRVGIFELEGGP